MAIPHIEWLGYLEQLHSIIKQLGCAKIIAATACTYAAFKLIYALYLSPLRNVPGPLIARITAMRSELLTAGGSQARKALEDYELYGDVYVNHPNSVSISNPADIRRALATHSFRKHPIYTMLNFADTANTLSARDPHLASMRRRQIGPYFSNVYLAKMETAILEHGIVAIKEKWDALLEKSENGQIEVHYNKTFLYATFDTIGSLAFGRDFGSLKNDDPTVSKWLRGTMVYFGMKTTLPFLSYFPFSLLISPFKRLYTDLINHGASCIATRRALLAELEAKGELDQKPSDLLQGLLSAVDPESKTTMSPTEVMSEGVLVLIAGSETSSNTLTWTVHLLMLYPECYRRAVDEVRSAFGKDHVITFSEAKAKLPYLEACIYESLRAAPATGGQWPRVAPAEGVILGGHFIPGGTAVTINISGANYNRNYWENPHLFDPTRFLGNDEAKRNVFTFSYGVRVCPGRQLAWIEVFTILANVLKDYDLRLPDGYTERGPSVLNEHGYPQLMDSVFFGAAMPKHPERDCRIVIAKA